MMKRKAETPMDHKERFGLARIWTHLMRAELSRTRELSLPRWVQTPETVPDMSEWRDDQEEVQARVILNSTAAIIISELLAGHASANLNSPSVTPSRNVPCWITTAEGNPAQVAHAYIGGRELGFLDKDATALVSTLISQHAGRHHALGTWAEIRSSEAGDTEMVVFLPDRP